MPHRAAAAPTLRLVPVARWWHRNPHRRHSRSRRNPPPSQQRQSIPGSGPLVVTPPTCPAGPGSTADHVSLSKEADCEIGVVQAGSAPSAGAHRKPPTTTSSPPGPTPTDDGRSCSDGSDPAESAVYTSGASADGNGDTIGAGGTTDSSSSRARRRSSAPTAKARPAASTARTAATASVRIMPAERGRTILSRIRCGTVRREVEGGQRCDGHRVGSVAIGLLAAGEASNKVGVERCSVGRREVEVDRRGGEVEELDDGRSSVHLPPLELLAHPLARAAHEDARRRLGSADGNGNLASAESPGRATTARCGPRSTGSTRLRSRPMTIRDGSRRSPVNRSLSPMPGRWPASQCSAVWTRRPRLMTRLDATRYNHACTCSGRATRPVLLEQASEGLLEEVLGGVGFPRGSPQEAVDPVVMLFVGRDQLRVAATADQPDGTRSNSSVTIRRLSPSITPLTFGVRRCFASR